MGFFSEKKSRSVALIYAIVLFLFIMAFLIIPFRKNASSWISFVFTIIGFVFSLIVCGVAFKAKKTLVSRIYGYPIFRIGVIYALAQFLTGVAICTISAFVNVPFWISILVSVVLLGMASIVVIITDNTRDIIEKVDETTKSKTKKMVFFQIDIAGIIDDCGNPEAKAELVKLNELFKYSDPVSNEETMAKENTINSLLTDLKIAVEKDDTDSVMDLTKQITNALRERNRICQATKKS